MKSGRLAFLDCEISISNGGHLKTDVYSKPTHTDQYLRFDSHHPLEHKLGVIRTLQHRANTIPTDTAAREAEEHHIKKALSKCGYPSWTFVKAGKAPKESSSRSRREGQLLPKRKPVVIPYVSGVSEQLRRIFSKHRVSVAFKPQNTLRQKSVHPKDRVPRHKQSNIVYAVKCQEDWQDLYIGETKQPLAKPMAQHRRATSSGQDSAVYLHLQASGHSFNDEDVHILDREERWFERRVKEAIYVKRERPSLNRGGGLRVHLSPSYNAVIAAIPQLCEWYSWLLIGGHDNFHINDQGADLTAHCSFSGLVLVIVQGSVYKVVETCSQLRLKKSLGSVMNCFSH
ncbi:uncharacterized protein LOC134644818 [Pelmatolapia mariae]|uniref:uncharacterized protein LOC134644818 n=1 Tax=Pelmatolapia mariae TaxID=158779 RepID=UPI002FE6BF2B